MMTLEKEIQLYDEMRAELEEKYFNRWIIIRGTKVSGPFEDSAECVQFAIEHFGRGPYLIRQVGAPPLHLPASAILVP